MKSTMNLRAAIEDRYDRKNGKQYGLAIGLVFGEKWNGARLSELRRNHSDT